MGGKPQGKIMQNYEFKLTPAFCLYNGTAIAEQNGSYIRFLTENKEDSVLHSRLEKAFRNHLDFVVRQKDCGPEYKNLPRIEFVAGTHEEVRNCISLLYHENGFSSYKEKLNEDKEKKEAAAVLLLDSVLEEARKRKATDIHIEKSVIRFRINGKLEDYASIQKDRSLELVLRIKLISGMNVLEKRKSQDGHFVYGETKPVFVRVSVMAVIGEEENETDESVVMRLLDMARLPLGLMNLGFCDRQLIVMDSLLQNKNGLILVCGPTGSGKSTTAASMLLERIKETGNSEKIISIEDPPEYVIPGVTQIKIDKELGITYESALEKIFRQDPDVIMVGEIRDKEGAASAIRAAMTGHLVLATLHTDSAPSSILRLQDLGGSKKIIDSVLRGVIIQELQHSYDSVMLLADICIPEKSESDGFKHVTNVPELMRKTGKLFAKKMLLHSENKMGVKESV